MHILLGPCHILHHQGHPVPPMPRQGPIEHFSRVYAVLGRFGPDWGGLTDEARATFWPEMVDLTRESDESATRVKKLDRCPGSPLTPPSLAGAAPKESPNFHWQACRTLAYAPVPPFRNGEDATGPALTICCPVLYRGADYHTLP